MALHTYLIRLISEGGTNNSVRPLAGNEDDDNTNINSKACRINNWGKAGFMFLVIVPNTVLAIIGLIHFTKYSEFGLFSCAN